MNWEVNCYNKWHEVRLKENFDPIIEKCDLQKLDNFTKSELEHTLSCFIPEVTKSKGEGPYPGKTLYEMIVSIQKHLTVNNLRWRLVENYEFFTLRTVLDNMMQERSAMIIGTVIKKADFITHEFEEKLWHKGILGEDSPDRLQNTVLYLLGVNLPLCAGAEHYQLRRDAKGKPLQFSFERNEQGIRCLVYCEDTVTKIAP